MKDKNRKFSIRQKKTEMLCGFVLEDSDKILGLNKSKVQKLSASIKAITET